MEQPDLFKLEPERPRKRKEPQEWKVVSLRECPSPESMMAMTGPQDAVDYWNAHVSRAVHFNPDCECIVVLMVNAKHRIKGHYLVSVGTLNEALASPREIFRAAVIAAAYAIVLMHNHPSGETEPSEADRRLTRRVKESGTLLGIALLDHLIVGHHRHFSFREAGLV